MRRRQFLKSVASIPIALSPSALVSSRTAASAPSGPDVQAKEHPWQPDGWEWRGLLGQLIPHNDTVSDSEFVMLAPDGISTHGMRVRYGGLPGSGVP